MADIDADAAVPPPVSTPWADPDHDVLADIRKIALMGPWPLHELHCAQDVADTIGNQSRRPPHIPPMTGDLARLFGVDIVVEHDWERGRWELREGDTVIDSGRLA